VILHGQTWIDSGGGPLLLLSQSRLPDWNGTDPSPQRTEGSDYSRACQVASYGGVIPVGRGEAFVLGDEPNLTTWHPRSDLPGGWLIRWVYAEEGTDLIRMLEANSSGWKLLETEYFEITDSPVVLFDSAYPGSDLPAHTMLIELKPGRYEVRTLEFNLEPRTRAIVHQFRCVQALSNGEIGREGVMP
jgi:hypothetical protein